jgi:hypothetical protein
LLLNRFEIKHLNQEATGEKWLPIAELSISLKRITVQDFNVVLIDFWEH